MLLQPSKLATTSSAVKPNIANKYQEVKSSIGWSSSKKNSESSNEKLIGRPLVPFFDDDDQLNSSLVPKDSAYEDMEVDARVWNSEGYFEYPEEQKTTNNEITNLSKTKSQPDLSQTGAPKTPGALLLGLITGAPMGKSSSSSSEKTTIASSADLLTPQSIPYNCPLERQLFKYSHSDKHVAESMPLSSSTTKTMPDNAKTKKSNHRGVMEYKSDSSHQKNKRGKKASAQSPRKKSGQGSCSHNVNNRKTKAKKAETLPTKWAWSAFQSSPDPKSLPIPTLNSFTEEPATFSSMDSEGENFASINDHVMLPCTSSSPSVILHPPHVAVPLSPPVPPPPTVKTPAPGSVEQNMTQDLRRMLNIG